MLPLTDGQRAFLLEATERFWAVRLDICDLTTGQVLRTIQTTTDDPLDGEALAITGGSVRVDTASDVLRTLSLELVDPFHELDLGVTGLIGLDKLFKVWKGYKIPAPWGDGSFVLWPLGTFILNAEPSVDATGGVRIIRIQAGDKSCLGNGRPRGGFQTAYRVSQGATKRAAIQALGELWGEMQFNLTGDSTATLPQDYPFESRDAPYPAAQRINEITEPSGAITRLLYDPWGRLTLILDPGPDLDTLPAVWTAKPVDSGPSQLVGAQRQPDLMSLANAVRVFFGSSRAAQGCVIVSDDNAASPTYTGRIGWRIRDWKGGAQDELIRTAAEANARATFELRKALSYQEKVPLTLLEHPGLEPWDVINVQESQADINGNYQLLSLTIDLGASGVTQAEGWKVRSLV